MKTLFSFNLDDDLKEGLLLASRKNFTTMGPLLNSIIKLYLDKNKNTLYTSDGEDTREIGKRGPIGKKRRPLVCIAEGCERSTNNGARGLCHTHYSALAHHVKIGNTTWKELEAAGRSQPMICKAKDAYKRGNYLEPSTQVLTDPGF